MIRFAVLALCSAACGRSQGVSDQELPGLVVEAKKPEPAIDVERAAHDPAELSRALARPYRVMLAALGPHSVAVNTVTTVEERGGAADTPEGAARPGDPAGRVVSELSDHAQIDNGDGGSYHATYSNSADYGRETTFVDGKLFLRPRYQRWHTRDPEAPDEPAALRDQYFLATAAVWDLLAPGAELADAGTVEISGRPGRKIAVSRSAEPTRAPAEPLSQRAWREGRSVEAVTGEIVLDAAKGVPLTVKLSGAVGFSRDGRRFAMKLTVDSAISGLGTTAEIAPPADDDVVATPERRREVDDRDYLLQGIAPPLRRNPNGTAVPPAPITNPAAPAPPVSPSSPSFPSGPARPPASKARPDEPPRRAAKPRPEATTGATTGATR